MNISLFGYGGHSKVILELISLNGYFLGFIFDDDFEQLNLLFSNENVIQPIDFNFKGHSIIAIGDNFNRKYIQERVFNAKWTTLIHPSAIISDNVLIEEGSVIMAGVIIQSGSRIGKHCIINTGACIDHDCDIGDFVHVAPNCSLAGNVSIGDGTFIGIGSSIIQNISIGKWTIVGAGSVIITNQPGNCTVVGVPAKTIKIHNEIS